MEPASLPLELLVEIFQYLSPLCTWRLRSTAKSWNTALSTTFATTVALQGQNLEIFKRGHLAKPVSCIELVKTTAGEDREWCVALSGRHVAYLTYKCSNNTTDLVLTIQDIDGEASHTSLQTRGRPSVVVMDDVVAFIADDELYMFDLSGRMTIRPLPGKYRGGRISTGGNQVAILQRYQDPRSGYVIESNNLWIYKYHLDKWTVKSVPETSIVGNWAQGLIATNTVHIISVGIDACRPQASRDEQHHFVMHVRAGKKCWTHRYTLKQRNYEPSLIGRCEVCWTGTDYDICVGTLYGWHTIRMTLDTVVSTDVGHRARWRETAFKAINGGIDALSGFLWDETVPLRFEKPRSLLVNADYLVAFTMEGCTYIRHICAFRFQGRREGLLPLYTWEGVSNDKAAQIEKRRQLVFEDPAPTANIPTGGGPHLGQLTPMTPGV